MHFCASKIARTPTFDTAPFIAILGVVAVLALAQAAENLVQSAIHPTKAWLGA